MTQLLTNSPPRETSVTPNKPFPATLRWVPVTIGVGLLLALVAAALWKAVPAAGGRFVYMLDDAYIHLAIAKNLAAHGVWGVTRFQFGSASSSPLWTLLLAGIFRVLGPHELVPLIINLIVGIGVVLAAGRLLRRLQVGTSLAMVALVALVLAVPLPTLIFSGMEHTLHTLLCLLFLDASLTLLSAPSAGRRVWAVSLLLAALLPLARYESAFLIAVVGGVLLLQKRYTGLLLLAFASLVPICAFGLYSLHNGSYFLPNSVLLKASSATSQMQQPFARRLILSAIEMPHCFFLMVLCGGHTALSVLLKRGREPQVLVGAVITAMLALYMQFAGGVSSLRYEGFAIALGIVALAALWGTLLDPKAALSEEKVQRVLARLSPGRVTLVAAVILAGLFGGRVSEALEKTVLATTNIAQQQVQMALFLHKYYKSSTIAANDIGAINYFNDLHCLDLWGLNSIEICREKRDGIFDRDRIDYWASRQDVEIAIVYDSWYREGPLSGIRSGRPDGLPASWVKVATWKIPNNVICGDSVVTFYAVRRDAAERLRACLREFDAELPPAVISRHFDLPGSS